MLNIKNEIELIKEQQKIVQEQYEKDIELIKFRCKNIEDFIQNEINEEWKQKFSEIYLEFMSLFDGGIKSKQWLGPSILIEFKSFCSAKVANKHVVFLQKLCEKYSNKYGLRIKS